MQHILHWVHKTLGTSSFCPQNSLHMSEHWLYKERWKRSTGMLAPMLPTVVSCWLDVLWVVGSGSFLIYKGNCLSVEKPSRFAVLDTNWCAWHLLPYPMQRHLNCLSFPFTLWMANTIDVSIVSRLKNPSLTCLLPFIYTDWSGFNKWHQ